MNEEELKAWEARFNSIQAPSISLAPSLPNRLPSEPEVIDIPDIPTTDEESFEAWEARFNGATTTNSWNTPVAAPKAAPVEDDDELMRRLRALQ